jgi:acyl-CoA thioester hydrolase
MWEYKRRVKYYETDRMGVVHHSNYLRILEDARVEWLRENGMSYNELEKMGVIIPAVSAEEKFISFLHFDDPFKVCIKFKNFVGVKMKFHYQVINTDTNVLCYEGETSHFIAKNESDYKPYRTFKKDFPELYNRLVELSENN